MSNWIVRHDMDTQIVRNVYLDNEYGLPEDMLAWCVLDIGGHIGSFARLCCDRGAARVLSVEPCPANATLFCRNLAGRPRARLIRAAAASAFGRIPLWEWCGDPACRTILPGGRTIGEVDAVPLDWLALEMGGTVDLCKIDCEGAEYELIEQCDFSWAARLVVEFHAFGNVENAPARADACRARLASLGFREVCFEPIHTGDGYWYRLYKGERA